MKPREREIFLDMARGFVVLWIIVIHIAFHNSFGQPSAIKYLVLLIDVPAFFFISGMTRFIVAKEMTAAAIVKCSAVFTLLSFLFGGNLLEPLFLQNLSIPYWESFAWSYWFVPCYVIVLLFAETIITKLPRYKYIIAAGLWIAFPLEFFTSETITGIKIFGIEGGHIFFYLVLFLFGYFIREKIIFTANQKKVAAGIFIANLAGYACCYLFSDKNIFDLQFNKFPPQLPYVLASQLSIAVLVCFYSRIRKAGWISNALAHCGKNAIYYYAGQCVGTTVTRKYLVGSLNAELESWALKFGILLFVAVPTTIVSAEILRLILDRLGKAVTRGTDWVYGNLTEAAAKKRHR